MQLNLVHPNTADKTDGTSEYRGEISINLCNSLFIVDKKNSKQLLIKTD